MPPVIRNSNKFTRKVYIYGLVCPIENKIKYVGKTCFNIESRLTQHCRNTKKNNPKNEWIRSLKAKGLSPSVIKLKEVQIDELWEIEEQKAIVTYSGNNLFNLNKGGAGGRIGRNIYLKKFDDYLNQNYSQNTRKNYLNVVTVFLERISCERPIQISSNDINIYLNNYENVNQRNSVLCALKLFYTVIIKQPKKFKNLKFEYGHCKSRSGIYYKNAVEKLER